MMEKYIISKLKNQFLFFQKKIIHFVNVEINPRLQYQPFVHTYNIVVFRFEFLINVH
jgi:hypothetical protein